MPPLGPAGRGTGAQHFTPSAGTGTPSSCKIRAAPLEAGAVPPALGGSATAPPLPPPGPLRASRLMLPCSHKGPCRPRCSPGDMPIILVSGQALSRLFALARGQGRFPAALCPVLAGISAFHSAAGSRPGPGWGPAARGEPASPWEHSEPCACFPPARAPGAREDHPLPCPHRPGPMLRNKCSGQPQTEKSFYWYHT